VQQFICLRRIDDRGLSVYCGLRMAKRSLYEVECCVVWSGNPDTGIKRSQMYWKCGKCKG